MVSIHTGSPSRSPLRSLGSSFFPRPFSCLASLAGLLGSALISTLAFAQDPAAAEEPPADPAAAPAAPAPEPSAPTEADAQAAGEASLEVDDSLEVGEPSGGAGAGKLDEVVVTVDRRKKDVQKYSGVAAAFTESKLASVGITNAREMASMVPGLQIGVQEGNTEVFIRGIGSDNNTEIGDPAVALHLDGVYIPRPRGVGSMFYDIERVEVNSGPQGTVRGRNAMGGAVNIVSKRPKLEEFGADAEATFGTFAQRRYQGMVNIPVGSMLAFRAAAFSEVHDSYYENAGPLYDIPAGENADSYAYRLQLLYQPTKRFSALLGYDYTHEGGTGYLGANFQGPLTATRTEPAPTADNPDAVRAVAIPFEVPGHEAFPSPNENPRRVYMRGMNPAVSLWHEGYRAELNFDAGPVIFQALGSYRRLQYVQHTGANAGAVVPGYDFTPGNCSNNATCLPDAWTNGFWDSRSQSFIGELRAFAPDDSRLRWTAGLFYFNEDQQVFLGQVADPANGFGGGEFNEPNVKGASFAGYVDATFDVVDNFRVLGGVRLTHETKSRKDGLWALWQGFPNNGNITGGTAQNPNALRFGTEGFQYEGLNRETFNFDPGPDGTVDATDRVNLFLDGIKSFGARDTLPQAICNDPPTAAAGEVQQPRVIPNPDGPGMRCAYGVKSSVASNFANAIPQNNEITPTNFFDWRAGVEYDLAKDSLLYFTVTTGHKAGGFNDTAPGAMQGTYYNQDYKPESVLAFELGSKNTLFDRNLRLNASAFMYRYKDMVFQTIASIGENMMDSGGDMAAMNQAAPNTAVRQNAENVTPIYGFDLDITYRLPLGLEAEAHLLLMDAKFPDDTIALDTRISNTASENYLVDLGGKWLPRVSAATLNFTLSQLIFTEAGSFDWVIQGQTKTQSYMSVYNGNGKLLPPAPGVTPMRSAALQALQPPTDDPATSGANLQQRLTDVVPAYTRFDLGVGWKHPDGRIGINAYVNNVTNIAYSTSIISTPGLNLRFFNPPRTAGVRFRVEW
ncbi:MAG TPA: TonB-dependent receptor [Polyangiaceae bacterium]|nr:TonB-dependent receptor [Polyangiaceae bacterium]